MGNSSGQRLLFALEFSPSRIELQWKKFDDQAAKRKKKLRHEKKEKNKYKAGAAYQRVKRHFQMLSHESATPQAPFARLLHPASGYRELQPAVTLQR
ncbi:hypothetical protein Ccrd_014034 [Cynara cardunculus var. scolymus]|uniref:Uncharacterized protein n=1 Tax=Cynara cardunculus var. scolymus TaxID=59895 RepID=A0A103YEJ5_CYNCS|nr:hypothetical protein Ccrd_014034 [Cynara cardunculus var. scolymus]